MIKADSFICGNYFNYQRTECLEVIPNGYYCNDTLLKTIDKCHENCKTCKKGPNEKNNNCLSCKNTKFFDLGNCVDKCINGYYTDIDDINKCKCSNNIKCFYCSEKSKEYNLCLSCNNQKGYYQKSDDEQRSDSFINCYKNLEGYYLDNNIYKPCYSTCKKCYELGNEENNKCIECINTHEFKNYLGNSNNCYEKCDYYYYIDSSNLYHCTENCPNDYNKLIIFKKKCIDNCINDDIYKYEYQNYCYQECPPNTISSTNNIFICEKIEILKSINIINIFKNGERYINRIINYLNSIVILKEIWINDRDINIPILLALLIKYIAEIFGLNMQNDIAKNYLYSIQKFLEKKYHFDYSNLIEEKEEINYIFKNDNDKNILFLTKIFVIIRHNYYIQLEKKFDLLIIKEISQFCINYLRETIINSNGLHILCGYLDTYRNYIDDLNYFSQIDSSRKDSGEKKK